jgi:hypothetical protein
MDRDGADRGGADRGGADRGGAKEVGVAGRGCGTAGGVEGLGAGVGPAAGCAVRPHVSQKPSASSTPPQPGHAHGVPVTSLLACLPADLLAPVIWDFPPRR